jgi:hypothetical protein
MKRQRRWYRSGVWFALAVVTAQVMAFGAYMLHDPLLGECAFLALDVPPESPRHCRDSEVLLTFGSWAVIWAGLVVLALLLPVLAAVSLWDVYRASRSPSSDEAGA